MGISDDGRYTNRTFKRARRGAYLSLEQSKAKRSSQQSYSSSVIHAGLTLNLSLSSDRKNQYNELKKSFNRFEMQHDAQSIKLVPKKDIHGNLIEKEFDKDEILCKLYQSEFKRLTTEFNDEFDALMFLPYHMSILGIEIKQAMKIDGKVNNKQTKEAAEQTLKRKAYVQKTFGDLLDQGWQYFQVIAVYDNYGSLVHDKCYGCSPFILTNGTAQEEKQQMHNLLASLNNHILGAPTHSYKTSIAYDNFKHIFSRLIGLSGFLMTVQKFGPYQEIMGTYSMDLNAGWTRASPLKFGLTNGGLRDADIFGRPHDCYKLIFYRPDQIGLLSLSTQVVVFLNDYGSGKKKYSNNRITIR